jgi:hypothetical protein
MKALLWLFKVIIGIPLAYYFSVMYMHYVWHYCWEISYKMAPLGTVGIFVVLAIRYAIKNGG